MPNTPLKYRNEVRTGLTLDEAQDLARPRTLSPLQQEFMSWYHQLYHLPYLIIFWLESLSFLPKILREFLNNPPFCVACQFGQVRRRPWQTKGNESGSIQRPEQTKPGDGVSVDQIFSAQPGLIPQTSRFITNKRLLGATIFVDHVSEYVYVHLMRDLSLIETFLVKSEMEKFMAQAGQIVKH